MKKLFLLLIVSITLNCYSQISFESGYFIDNNNKKTVCLIKNLDWNNNPSKFEYKLSENSKPEKITINKVKEFGIDNASKYIRSTILIDRSSESLNQMSFDKEPKFNEEVLLLKVLIEGKANLFLYQEGGLKRFFYNIDNSNIKQLIYKSYKTVDDRIGKNNTFKNQLWNELKCTTFDIGKLKNLKYQKKELTDFFIDYNECVNQQYTNYNNNNSKIDFFNITIRPGINSSNLSVKNNEFLSEFQADFDNELTFRLGVEAEFILPFNKNKWAVMIEPTYQYYKSKTKVSTQNIEVDYKSIELPIGFRHYFFLNKNSKLFINASFVIDISLDSEFTFDSEEDLDLEGILKVESTNNLAFGFGYKHNDKYSLELRYQTSRNILNNYVYFDSDYNTFSIIFGYSIF